MWGKIEVMCCKTLGYLYNPGSLSIMSEWKDIYFGEPDVAHFQGLQ